MEKNCDIGSLVRKWGHGVSLALHDPTCKIFHVQGVEGVIGYRLVAGCAVVLGDPVSSLSDMTRLMDAFDVYCREHNLRTMYVAVSQACSEWALAKTGYSVIEIGSEIVLDPVNDLRTSTGRRASVLRNKYNQAVRQGMTVKEYHPYDAHLEQAIEQLAAEWKRHRPKQQLYLYQLNLFGDRENKRWFCAELEGSLIGLLFMNRLDAYQGWVLNMLMRAPDASPTTSEFLVLSVLDTLAKEECRFFSIGVLPGCQVRPIKGLNRASVWFLCNSYTLVQKMFTLQDRQRYWEKFKPHKRPSFLFSNGSIMGPKAMLSILRAFNISLF